MRNKNRPLYPTSETPLAGVEHRVQVHPQLTEEDAVLAARLLLSAADWYDDHAANHPTHFGVDVLRVLTYGAEATRLREAAGRVLAAVGEVAVPISTVDPIEAVGKGEFIQ